LNRKQLIAALFYALMLGYASLFPFQGWRLPDEGLLAWCSHLPDNISRSDLFVNVIAYLPLGFLLLRLLPGNGAKALSVLLATAAGIALSFTMELTQAFLPSRTSSTLDLFTNGLGTMLGALSALLWQESAAPQGALGRWRDSHLQQGRGAEIGVGVLLCWALSQLAPFVPSLDLGGIKHALKPLWYTAHDLSRFDLPHAATYCCYLAALGVAAQVSVRQRSRPLPFFTLFAFCVLSSKIFILGRELSLEALSGLLGAVALWVVMSLCRERMRRYLAMSLVLVGFAVYELKSGGGGSVAASFNWIPFRGELARELTGFGSILEGVWPFAALSLFFLLPSRKGERAFIVGGILVLLFVFTLEWLQLTIPGRSADLTPVLLALSGWLAPWLYLRRPDKIVVTSDIQG